MSKKLLEESTIRSFMKLANLEPLSQKFISENYGQKTEGDDKQELEEQELEEEELEEEKEPENESAPPDTKTTAKERGRDESKTLEEVVEEDDDNVKEEGKESEGRPSSKKESPKGTSLAGKKPAKMDAAKNAAGDAKFKPMKQTHVHSDKPDSIEHNKKSNAQSKNNSEFEIVSESLEEMADMPEEMDSPEGGDTPSADAGEGGDHQEKMKGLIRQMLENLKQMGEEYGMSMEISDEGSGEETPDMGAVESPPEAPEGGGDEMMQEKLDEMVEKLTKRVAARLVKESKKRQ